MLFAFVGTSLGLRRGAFGCFLNLRGVILTKMNVFKNYFTKFELILWGGSVLFIIAAFLLFDRSSYLTLTASLIGVTALILSAKGNPLSQVLMIIFCFIYGFISLKFKYYGELITYMGMSMPMSVFALVSWLKNPAENGKAEVKVNKLKFGEHIFMWILTLGVTVAFYFILSYFNTANILPSTFSVTTSFLAIYLTARRSPFYAIAYAFNDVILIVLWVLASFEDFTYISVSVCFAAFLVNDLYGFINWRKMEKRQREKCF